MVLVLWFFCMQGSTLFRHLWLVNAALHGWNVTTLTAVTFLISPRLHCDADVYGENLVTLKCIYVSTVGLIKIDEFLCVWFIYVQEGGYKARKMSGFPLVMLGKPCRNWKKPISPTCKKKMKVNLWNGLPRIGLEIPGFPRISFKICKGFLE